jgi:hypothetical protein
MGQKAHREKDKSSSNDHVRYLPLGALTHTFMIADRDEKSVKEP